MTDTLSGADLDRLCGGRWADHDGETLLDVVITDPASECKVEATIIPTRMHAPGWYVRARGGTPIWASWRLRSDDELAMIRRFADQGWVGRA